MHLTKKILFPTHSSELLRRKKVYFPKEVIQVKLYILYYTSPNFSIVHVCLWWNVITRKNKVRFPVITFLLCHSFHNGQDNHRELCPQRSYPTYSNSGRPSSHHQISQLRFIGMTRLIIYVYSFRFVSQSVVWKCFQVDGTATSTVPTLPPLPEFWFLSTSFNVARSPPVPTPIFPSKGCVKGHFVILGYYVAIMLPIDLC